MGRDFWAKERTPKIMITEFVSGRDMWTRSEFLTKPHGNKGDASVIAVSGAWQGRRLTSPPRGLSELRLLGGLLTASKDAGAANVTKSPGGSAAFTCSSIIVLFFHPFASTESSLSTVQRDRRKGHSAPHPEALGLPGDVVLPLREPAAGTGPCP